MPQQFDVRGCETLRGFLQVLAIRQLLMLSRTAAENESAAASNALATNIVVQFRTAVGQRLSLSWERIIAIHTDVRLRRRTSADYTKLELLLKLLKASLFLLILAHSFTSYAACKTERCKQAVSWKTGYAAIVLDEAISHDDYFRVLAAVKANQGTVAIESERVLLAWVPVSSSGRVRATPGVRTLVYQQITNPQQLVNRPDGAMVLSFFNHVVTGEYEDSVERGLDITGAPLSSCTTIRSKFADTAVAESENDPTPIQATAARLTVGVNARRIAPEFHYRTPYQNPSLTGRVTVQVFTLDSNGAVDPNQYTWTTTDYNFAHDQVLGAFTFWADQARARGITLSFRPVVMDPFSRFTRAYIPTPTSYEPITHVYTDEYLWVNDALSPLGYGASPVSLDNVLQQNETFNSAQKADPTFGPFDRSFSVYVVYNPPPALATFAGPSYKNAHAEPDGPFIMVMWNSGGWGSSNLGRIVTHETGHVFWACDEYGPACTSCGPCWLNVGPRNSQSTPWITNANCESTAVTTGCDIPTMCIMKNNDLTMCVHTPQQIGW